MSGAIKERSFFRTLAKLGTVFVVNVVVLGFLILGFGREYLRNLEIERNISMMEKDQAALEGKKLEALSVIESLSSEYYLEQEGRMKHGLAKPGEELVIVHTANAQDLGAAGEGEEVAAQSNVWRWYLYFFDHRAFETLRNEL